jgi:MFS family permease
MTTTYLQKVRLFSRNARLYIIAWALIGFGYIGIYLVLANLYLLRLGYGPEFVGLVNGIGLFAMVPSSLPAGALGRRWGSRRMMIAGMILMTAGFGFIPLAESVPTGWRSSWLVGNWVLACLAAPLFTVNGPPFLMGSTTPEERDHAFSVSQALSSLSGFAGSVVGGFLPGLFSSALGVALDQPAPYRYPLFLVAVLFFVGILVVLATREVGVGQTQESAAGEGRGPFILIAFAALFRLLLATGDYAPSTFLNVYMDAGLHAPTSLIGSVAAVGRLMGGVAALAMPIVVQRWGKEPTIGLGTMAVAFSLVVLVLVPHWGTASIGFIAAIALVSLVNSAFNVYGQEIVSPGWRAVMSGANWMAMGVGASSIVAGGGYIIAALGYRSLFLTAAALTGVGAILFWAYFRVPRGELARTPPSGSTPSAQTTV